VCWLLCVGHGSGGVLSVACAGEGNSQHSPTRTSTGGRSPDRLPRPSMRSTSLSPVARISTRGSPSLANGARSDAVVLRRAASEDTRADTVSHNSNRARRLSGGQGRAGIGAPRVNSKHTTGIIPKGRERAWMQGRPPSGVWQQTHYKHTTGIIPKGRERA